jgi:single-strand DNA-binding protein
MASENTVTLVGNVTDDPELRYTPSGAAVANFTVAVNKRYRGSDGQWEDKLDGFFRCSCWREMAEHVTEACPKGTRVIVVGRLQQRSWETQEGQKRYEVEVQVDEVGPSLRWATAQVQKSTRSGGGQQFGGGQGGGGQQFGGQQQGQGQGGAWPGQGQAAPQQQPAAGQQPSGPAGGQQPPTEGNVDDWGSPVGGQQMDEGGF